MPSLFRRALLRCGLSLALPLAAQTWPSEPVRLIVPFPAGGATPQQFAAVVRAESAKWKKVITERKITAI